MIMAFRLLTSATLLFLFPLGTRGARSTTWHVKTSVASSGDGTTWETAFKSIREGIDIASDGDTVMVAQGTYMENVCFDGKNIVLRSTDPLDSDVVAKTIIDGSHAGSVITFSGTEGETCVLAGFTVQNGYAEEGGGIYGGTDDNRTRATVRNNVITANWAQYGGGLYGCSGTIRSNIIIDNSAWSGGGLNRCHGLLQNNTIAGNSAVWGCGGLHFCAGIIQNNTIHGNTGISGGGLAFCDGAIEGNTIYDNHGTEGGGLFDCGGTIQSNIIALNSARFSGGGLHLCGGTIENNTIVGNSAVEDGGGLYLCGATIRNCIIWENTAPLGPQLWGPSQPSYSCVEGWTGGGQGNTTDNPEFLDPRGADNDPATYDDNNYRLSANSPCIDAGKNESWMSQAADLDGNPRIFYGVSSFTVDMGAYEHGSFFFEITEVKKGSGDDTELRWNSRPGDTYTVWSCSDFSVNEWTEKATVPSQGTTSSWTDPAPFGHGKFYRIEMK